MELALIIVVVIIIFAGVIVGSIVSYNKTKKNMFSRVQTIISKQKLSETDNSDYIEDMEDDKNIKNSTVFTSKTYINGKEVQNMELTDDGVLIDNVKGILNSVANSFGVEQEDKQNYIVCEYCGTENESKKRKCVSCGANLKTKK